MEYSGDKAGLHRLLMELEGYAGGLFELLADGVACIRIRLDAMHCRRLR